MRDADFWTSERMDFNFIDFDRDNKISKNEYLYYLDNFAHLEAAHSLTVIHESNPNPSKMDPLVAFLAAINILIVMFSVRYVMKSGKRDDSFKKKMSILV